MNSTKIFIYRIYFPVSDKCYIGQTCDIERRMLDHVRGKYNSLVHKALQKYKGWKISVLHTCKSRDEANRIEIEEIRNFDSVSPGGYNLTHGGEGGTPSEETRKKLSVAQKGNKHSEETRQKMSQTKKGSKGHKTSEETKQKISSALKGHKVLDVTKQKHRAYKHSAESKRKIIIACAKKRYQDYQQKIKNLEQEIG